MANNPNNHIPSIKVKKQKFSELFLISIAYGWLIEQVMDTALPSASTTVTWEVPLLSRTNWKMLVDLWSLWKWSNQPHYHQRIRLIPPNIFFILPLLPLQNRRIWMQHPFGRWFGQQLHPQTLAWSCSELTLRIFCQLLGLLNLFKKPKNLCKSHPIWSSTRMRASGPRSADGSTRPIPMGSMRCFREGKILKKINPEN